MKMLVSLQSQMLPGAAICRKVILLSVSQASLLHPIASVKLELASIDRSNPKRKNLG
jgi:hypothetical protein